MTRRVQIVIAALLLTGGVLGGRASAAPPDGTANARPHATAAGPTTITGNPVTIQMDDPAKDGLVVRGVRDGHGQILQAYDYAGNPIAGIAPYGGMWVAGDNFRIFPPGDIFNASITLHMHGSITIGGPDGPTIYGGADDPNVSSPCVDRPCRGGDRYLSKVAPYPTLVFDGTAWVTG